MDNFKQMCPLSQIPYHEIKLLNKLYEGNRSIVYKSSYKNTNYITKLYFMKDDLYESMLYQLIIAKAVNQCKNVIHTYGVTISEKDNIVGIMMEDLNGEDLYDYLQTNIFWKQTNHENNDYAVYNSVENTYYKYIMKYEDKIHIIKQMIEAIHELHSLNIIHNDIKLQNFIIYKDKENIPRVKCIDLECCYFIDHNKPTIYSKHVLGTDGYMNLSSSRGLISKKTDIYSLGVSMVEVMNGDIWGGEEESYEDTRKTILYFLKKIHIMDENIGKIIKRCISTDEKKIPMIQTVLKNIL
jgi:serine/threonine protein kinase